MALTIASGETETIESGTDEYGAPTNVAGQLNVAGTLNTYPPPFTATGIGEGAGAASLSGTAARMAAGVGSATGAALGTPTTARAAAGSGAATGAATALWLVPATATGIGTATGTAAEALLIVPAVRRDDATMQYDDTEGFALDTDRRS